MTSSALQAGAERSWVIAAVAGTPPRALGRVSSCLRLPHTWVEKDEGPTLSPRCPFHCQTGRRQARVPERHEKQGQLPQTMVLEDLHLEKCSTYFLNFLAKKLRC